MDVTLKVKKYKTEGDVAWEYHPLRNIKADDGSITNFQVDNDQLNISLENPIDIECQQSYDGSVNLILNDDINPPRIINSRVTLLEGDRYKVINRNQNKQSNLYDESFLDQETRLFRNVQKIPKLKLNKVSTFGQLKGGNYIFYLKYLDEDFNETDIVAETGIISVFKGTINNPKTCSGAFMDERTDKSILLNFYNIDTSFKYFNLYCLRNTCDQNGVLVQETYKIDVNYEIVSSSQLITITGYEETSQVTVEDLNIQYNYVESVKTQTQVQNMLFFANVEKNEDENTGLRNLSLHIVAKEVQDENYNIGYIHPDTFVTKENLDDSQIEYYSPQNLYYRLGYFPKELYRFGIVYIFNDDHLSSVYNLRGIDFNYTIEKEGKINFKFENKIEDIEFTDFLDKTKLENTNGVFRFSKDIDIIDYSNQRVVPLGIQFQIPEIVIDKLKEYNIKGYFFVRQKRIPNFLAQGFSIGVDEASSVPTLRDGTENGSPKYIAESFINTSRVLNTEYNSRKIVSNMKSSSGLLCIDSYVDKQLQSLFNGSEFNLIRKTEFEDSLKNIKTRIYYPNYKTQSGTDSEQVKGLIYVDSEVPQRILDDYAFSTKAGMQEDLKQVVSFGHTVTDNATSTDYIRGIFTSFIGVKGDVEDNCLYDIYIKNYSEAFLEEYFTIRMRDNSPFFAVSDRYSLSDEEVVNDIEKDQIVTKNCPLWETSVSDYEFEKDLIDYLNTALEYKDSIDDSTDDNIAIKKYITDNPNFAEFTFMQLRKDYLAIDNSTNKKLIPISFTYKTNINLNTVPIVFRGDCFTGTVCTRMHRNFTSTSVPINDTIVDPNCWKDNFKGARSTTDWDAINKADVDAVPIGTWFVYKCLSNSNIGLRSLDPFNTDEYALMGNYRNFYPVNDISVKSSAKIPESALLNFGYNTTVGVKRNYAFEIVPYIKDIFDTRIMFSNVQVDGSFKNSYKVFQGLSYEDMDRQYGGIVKILPWQNNILCVFEHAIAIVPVNEKALIQTTQGQNIHMYGSGVLQKQMTMISDMYGSSWKDSIIRTPRALYGVDTYAKKIWKLSEEGFELISEFNIQRYLNDNINLKKLEKSVILGVRNVKTHFNSYKNDVMFTFYNKDKIWNICYNEVRKMWVTRYSWTPFFSGNLYNSYFSFDLSKTNIYGILNNNLRKQSESIIAPMNPWNGLWDDINIDKDLRFISNSEYANFNIQSVKITGYYWDERVKSEVLIDKHAENDYSLAKVDNDNFIIEANNVIIPKSEKDEETGLYFWKVGEEYLTLDGVKIQTKDNNEASQQYALYVYYISYVYNKEDKTVIKFKKNTNSKYLYYIINIEYTPYLLSKYKGIYNSSKVSNNDYLVFAATRSYDIGLLIPENQLKSAEEKNKWRKALLNNIYLHGRAGNIDEVDYNNPDSKRRIFPTKWYDKQEPFEFEFVVNTPAGLHKIFDNLVIVSNNVEPESLEIEIVGDVYDFDKENIYSSIKKGESITNIFPKILLDKDDDKNTKKEYYTTVTWDNMRNEYSLLVHQDCLNIKEYGRRLGNIYYNHDMWYTVIQPIYYENETLKSTRVRDKYAIIRVRYNGTQLATISALHTIMTQGYV